MAVADGEGVGWLAALADGAVVAASVVGAGAGTAPSGAAGPGGTASCPASAENASGPAWATWMPATTRHTATTAEATIPRRRATHHDRQGPVRGWSWPAPQVGASRIGRSSR